MIRFAAWILKLELIKKERRRGETVALRVYFTLTFIFISNIYIFIFAYLTS